MPAADDKTLAAAAEAGDGRGISAVRLVAGAILTLAVALALDAAAFYFGRAVLGVPDDVEILTTTSVFVTALTGVVAGAVGLSVLVRHALRPLTAFRKLAVLVGLLSLAGPVAAAAGLVPEVDEVGGGTFATLVLMNALTTSAIATVLPAIAGVHDTASTPS